MTRPGNVNLCPLLRVENVRFHFRARPLESSLYTKLLLCSYIKKSGNKVDNILHIIEHYSNLINTRPYAKQLLKGVATNS